MAAVEEKKKLVKAAPTLSAAEVDAAAKEIGEILQRTLFKGTTDVGEYILKTFFEDNVELAQSHNPSKESSFRKLSERCGTPGLPVGKTYLNTAVGVAIMCRRMLEEGRTPKYKELPPSHQVALLPLREPKTVEDFAKRIVKDHLNVRDVKEDVKKVVAKRSKASGRGRKATPLVLRTLDRTLRLFEHESRGKSFTSAQVGALDEEQKAHTLKTTGELIASLQKLAAQLKVSSKKGKSKPLGVI